MFWNLTGPGHVQESFALRGGHRRRHPKGLPASRHLELVDEFRAMAGAVALLDQSLSFSLLRPAQGGASLRSK
jgi:hypothetical protein